MLSIANPPPPESDPPLPCPLKKKKKKPHLDPSSSSSSSPLDHHHHQINNINPSQAPNFSIRDYVFAVRRKDVKKNWPFSPENLQLCLNHGVKHPLPPFQTTGSVKDQSLRPCTVEKCDDPPTTQELAVQTCTSKPGSENAHQSEIACLESDQLVLHQSTVKYPPLRSTSRPASKKCRLVVKFGASSAEDVASNLTTAACELMASSKTCPVCKTFSSSSNTTLNAHIDQCLALGSKPVSAPSSRVIRHKIKPRKIRLMTDIYTTAKECTLEELDRRNGTSWAAMSSKSPALDGNERSKGVHGNGKSQTASLDRSKDGSSEQTNVYVDANGTKVRILSKLNDDGKTAKKRVKGGKGGKFFSFKRKSVHGKKKHKYLKLVPESTKLLPPKAHSCQVSVDPEGSREENHRKEELGGAPKPIKFVSRPGRPKQWMPLKFTTVTKEPSKKGCRRNQFSENDEPYPRDSFARRSNVEKAARLSGNKVGHTERPLLPMKRSTDHSSSTVVGASLCRSPPIPRSAENDRNWTSPFGKRKIFSSAGLGKTVKESPQSAAQKQQLCAGKTRFSFKQTGSRVLDDEELVTREHSINRENDMKQIGYENHHLILSDSSSERPRRVSGYFHCDNGEIADSSPRVLDGYDDDISTSGDSDSNRDDDDHNDDDVLRDFDCIGITEERGTTSLSRFLGTEFIRRSHSETPFDSSVDDYTGASSEGQALLRPPEPCFLGGQEEYSVRNDAGDAMGDRMDMDLDSETGQGSSFPEVEPIPIPGPPGSFLPSPRDMMMMTSDDFPGHSSLTTSPIRSSEDHRDFIDRVSSDSPLSMASTVSNSRPDHMKYFEQLTSAEMAPGQEKNRDSAVSSLRTSVATERQPVEAEKFDFNGFAIEKRSPFGFRSDDQPCCCQRKEKSLSLNSQESQLLKRRTMASADRQMGFLPNTSLANSATPADSGPGNVLDMPTRRPLSDIDRTITSPSGSNPVLRLMGKNLMVVNTEEETFRPSFHRPADPRGSLMFDSDSSEIRNLLSANFASRVPQNPSQSPVGTAFKNQNHYAGQFSLFNTPQDHQSSAILPNSDHFSHMKLSCSPEDPQKIYRSSHVAASPSTTTHLSSSLFYS